ncbi:DUF7576 family protein [Halobacterium zhouii]|uniref:DUF7576 family protein n=1 Tax=Halobacterium zhouii TaxID=2902624 RepID=UPI001E348A9C|nr:hypothetical protein [Halobacterium zhouii]
MGGRDEEEPTAPSNGQRDDQGAVCEYCGTPIDTSEWYPVTNRRDPDGSVELYAFCSETCQDSWCDEQTE